MGIDIFYSLFRQENNNIIMTLSVRGLHRERHILIAFQTEKRARPTTRVIPLVIFSDVSERCHGRLNQSSRRAGGVSAKHTGALSCHACVWCSRLLSPGHRLAKTKWRGLWGRESPFARSGCRLSADLRIRIQSACVCVCVGVRACMCARVPPPPAPPGKPFPPSVSTPG